MKLFLAVFVGGGLGSIARFLISNKITSGFKVINPVGTMTANIISTIILGLILFISMRHSGISDNFKALLITGFCGGFSTFSTFSYETFELLRTGQYWFATANIFVSILLGVGVLFVIAKSIGT